MHETFDEVLGQMEAVFRRLEAQVPPPVRVPHKDGFVLRYREKNPQQALLQKFARQISGLYAINLLLSNGFLQEQGVIQRILDEIIEDILYITLGISTGNWTDNHNKYLEYFWMEEPGAGMVPRKTIRAYVNRAGGLQDPSTADDIGRRIYRAYSGYVHANSVSIVDMCVGDPPRYRLAGMIDSPLYGDYEQDAWNYFYRGLFSSVVIAKAFEDGELWIDCFNSMKAFEKVFASKIFI